MPDDRDAARDQDSMDARDPAAIGARDLDPMGARDPAASGARDPAASGARNPDPSSAGPSPRGVPAHIGRDAAARAADHAGIDRLAGTLLPTLIAKLGTLNVGELEVREGDWRIRLRRPAGPLPTSGRRATDRPSRAHPGHEPHGRPPGAPEPTRTARTLAAAGLAAGQVLGSPVTPAGDLAGDSAGILVASRENASTVPSTNGSGGPNERASGRSTPGTATGPGMGTASGTTASGTTASRTTASGTTAGVGTTAGAGAPQLATSPAVGVFQPGPRAVGGTRVRAGDRLGIVDMLGVPQEVVSPVDGIVVGVIVDAGTAVEYGQELVHVEPAAPVEGR